MYAIQDTKEVVKFAISLGEAFDKALADSKLGFSDVAYFVDAFKSAGPAISGIANVPKELADLDDAEKAELKAYVETEFDIANDKVELVIETAFAVVLSISDIIKLFKKSDA